MGRSPLNVHCHLAAKLSERASFNKFNKNFKIWHFQHENIGDKREILGWRTFNYSWYSVEWSGSSETFWNQSCWVIYQLVQEASDCKSSPDVENIGALSPARLSSVQQQHIPALDYILSLTYFAYWSGGPTYHHPPHPTQCNGWTIPSPALSQTAPVLVDPLSLCPSIFPSSPVLFRGKVNLKISAGEKWNFIYNI